MNAPTTHRIIGRAHIEGTQRGYVVWVRLDDRLKAQLTDATDDYTAATGTANSVDRGHWVGRRKGGTIVITGRVLVCTPVFNPVRS